MTTIPFVGDKAPTFKAKAVVDGDFEDISLSDYEGKYVILLFYPTNLSWLCPTEVASFSDRHKDFDAINCQVLAIATESHFTHLSATNIPRNARGLGDIHIPLISDLDHTISKKYGVLKKERGVAYRATFIIDRKGIVKHFSVNDFAVGRNVDETMRLVSAFKHADEKGEVCPAGWQPGDQAVKPGLEASKAYFDNL